MAHWMAVGGSTSGYLHLFNITLECLEFSEALYILLEGVSKNVSISEVNKELTSIPEIQYIHELHIWCICSNIYALSTHALISDNMVNDFEKILRKIKSLLANKFNIKHSTIQFETCLSEEVNSR